MSAITCRRQKGRAAMAGRSAPAKAARSRADHPCWDSPGYPYERRFKDVCFEESNLKRSRVFPLVSMAGVEPATYRFVVYCTSRMSYIDWCLVRRPGNITALAYGAGSAARTGRVITSDR